MATPHPLKYTYVCKGEDELPQNHFIKGASKLESRQQSTYQTRDRKDIIFEVHIDQTQKKDIQKIIKNDKNSEQKILENMASDLSGIVESSFPTGALVRIHTYRYRLCIKKSIFSISSGTESGNGRAELFTKVSGLRWPRCNNSYLRFRGRSTCNRT